MGTPESLDLAKRLFVEDGKKLAEICVDLDISIFVLNKLREEKHWDRLRAEHLEREASQDLEGEDTLAKHKRFVRNLFKQIEVIQTKLANPATLDSVTRKELKETMEVLRDQAETISMAVDVDRKVSGVKNSAPSVSDDANKEQGIVFKVFLPPAKEQTGTG